MRVIPVRLQNTDPYGRPAGGLVEVARAPTDTIPATTFANLVLGAKRRIERLSREMSLNLGDGGGKPYSRFFAALQLCFAGHHPFAIRPEVLWHLVATEVAQVVRDHPEIYRHLFTTSAERQRIEVRDDTLRRGDPTSDWSRTLGLFDTQMRQILPEGIMERLLPDFTTHTPESRAAATVAFMDAASPYYDYWTHTMCGIPLIRLDGEASDYRKMVLAATALAEVFHAHLGSYFAALIPVLATLAEQADGKDVDNDFWSSIYKFRSESGADFVTGWITAFLAHRRDEAGEKTLRRADDFDWHRTMQKWSGDVVFGSFPTHVSDVPFTWNYFGTPLPMTFLGGVLGADNDDGYICPRLSYGVASNDA